MRSSVSKVERAPVLGPFETFSAASRSRWATMLVAPNPAKPEFEWEMSCNQTQSDSKWFNAECISIFSRI
jgi:hypothetical protein